MAIRVTRVYAAVSGTPASALRVTRVSAAVSGTPDAAKTRLHRISLQLLTTIPPDQFSKSASNSLVFGQTAVNSLKDLQGVSGLTFSQNVSNPPQSVSSTNTLQFGSIASSSFKTPAAVSGLVFGHNVTKRVVDKTSVNSLVFSQAPQKVHIKAAATSHLGTSALVFSQTAKRTNEVTVLPSELRFSNTAVGDQFWELPSELRFSNTASSAGVVSRELPSSLVFSHQFLAVSSNISLCAYNPQIGGGTIAAGMDRYGPFLQDKNKVQFLYPFDVPTIGLEMKAPLFGDRLQYSADRIFRETDGGALIVFRDDDWATQDTRSMQFQSVKEAKAQEYATFVDTSLGKPIKYVDHEGRSWKALIVSTSDPAVRNQEGFADISLELFILSRLT